MHCRPEPPCVVTDIPKRVIRTVLVNYTTDLSKFDPFKVKLGNY